ncbi:S9 family peptidase [Bacillus sp. FJAT-42376]|uniref:S9 family peptidase n=1 Tax=Bacillus sp. FJAT-42376 TaxID=2014076 RepID=UPI000F4FD358|nr:S9 family peptidase [Bacillus sp. FJAT-42376]AZB44282.1 S9 family peptidase [Bacillus sp. FJAT-42376]
MKRKIDANDLYHIKIPADPRISPDGQQIVFTESFINATSYTYHSHLHVISRQNDTVEQWTFGESKNHTPRWSPAGNLAFVSDRSGVPQIYLMKSGGGEAKQLTSSGHGAANPVWVNEDQLLFQSYLQAGESLHIPKEKPDQPAVLEVTEMQYKSDRDGFIRNRKSRLFLLDLKTNETKELVTCEGGAESPALSGEYIACIHYPPESPGKGLVSDVLLINKESAEEKNLTAGKGQFSKPQFSPDGRFLAFFGHEKDYKSATLQKLWIYEMETERLQCLTAEWDMYAGDAAVSDSLYGAVSPSIQWTADSQGFYLLVSDRGSTGVYYGSVEGLMYPVRLESEHVHGLTMHPSEHWGILSISTPVSPSELFEVNFQTGEIHQLTRLNQSWLEEVTVSEPEPIETEAEDGWTIHGWLMKPAAMEDGKKYPLILEIHGGPHMMYANTYFHEFQVLASDGYAVLYVNPRGSHGYGQDFANLNRGDYGGSDYKDLMSAVDAAIAQYPFIDEERIGVTGGSYGGFMTNWMVGHTNRFKAAVTQRSISNWLSFYGVSDIGTFFTEWEVGGTMPEDAMKLWDHSPLKYADEIETPLLILHSEKDYRCPIEQAEQLYMVLKRKGKTVKFLRFPDQNHELSRSGHPFLRAERMNAIRQWFNEYM